MKYFIQIIIVCRFAQIAGAQTASEAVVQAALQRHPLAQAAAFDAQAKRAGEKAAIDLPNPEINVESPTGEFYAVGVLQSFDFPTVYIRQKQAAQAQTALAEAGRRVSENELRWAARALYLEAQAAAFAAAQARQRDSVYQAISAAAARQFAAGEIDFLQKTLAENEAGGARQALLAAERTAAALLRQLAAFSGLSDISALTPLRADTAFFFAAMPQNDSPTANPTVLYERQAVEAADRQIRLAKSKAMPNFSIGYLNQGARGTLIDYRFRASVGVPLWAGRYRAGVQVAEAESQAANARAEAQVQALALNGERVRTEALNALAQLRYYEQEALPRSRALMSASARMREAGQIDYVAFLRTMDEAYAIQQAYAAQLQAFEAARIRAQYLAGQ